MAITAQIANDNDYLNLFKISDFKFILGTFQYGITVYSQQVRALNIFHALMTTGKLPKDPDHKYTIGIIGGGIGGLTFAAAALKAKFNVVIIEKESNFLHMQQGCTVRNLHPHIYDWPTPGSLNTNAQLPVLSWRADTADGVAKQVLNQYNIIRNKVRLAYTNKGTQLEPIKEIFNAHNLNIGPTKKQGKDFHYIAGYSLGNPPINEDVNMLIYAVGYGIEKGVLNKTLSSPSYWRNEAYNQTRLMTSSASFYVIGTGDGALNDVFRLCIQKFSPELIIGIFEKNPQKLKLEESISNIKDEFLKGTNSENLYYSFQAVNQDHYKFIIDFFNENTFFRDNKVTLCGKEKLFRNIFKEFKISFLNAFLAFLLHDKLAKFSYEQNVITLDEERRVYKRSEEIINPEFVLLREGTERLLVYKELGFNEEETKELIRLKQIQESLTTNEVRWTHSDLFNHFDPELGKHFEYFSPEARSICTSLVSTVSELISDTTGNEKVSHRVALYRVMNSCDGPSFQQLTPYFGSKVKAFKEDDLRGTGNVYGINRGNIGYTFCNGTPLLIRRIREEDFKEVIYKIGLIEEYEKFKDINCALTIPLMAKYGNEKTTNLVLLIESSNTDLFEPTDSNGLLKTTNSVINGFINAVKHLISQNNIVMEKVHFSQNVQKNSITLSRDNKCFVDLSSIFAGYNKDENNCFESFCSFDFGFQNNN